VSSVLDAGITLLDTADIYGSSSPGGFGSAEVLLGDAIAADTSLRNRMVLATKAGVRPGVPYDQSPAYLTAALDASLKRLRVDTIDLWQIHRPDILTHPHDVARSLEDAITKGKVRAVGASNFSVHQIQALEHFLSHRLVSTQREISPNQIDCFDNGELDQAIVMGLTPIAWSPLSRGSVLNPQADREKDVATELDKVAERAGVTRDIAAYSWLMYHPAGIIPIIGSQNPERIIRAPLAFGVQWTRQEWYAVFTAARGKKLP
jgi:predicted oxidoreductase